MSLMGTLAKLAVGYAAARGVDRMGGVEGLAGLFGGASISPHEAEADQMPGAGNLQEMMSQMTGGAGGGMGGLQDMMAKMAGGAGGGMGGLQEMMSKMAGGASGGMGDLQDMIGKMAAQSGIDLSALTGGAPAAAPAAEKGGLLSGVPGGGTGLAGMLAAMGGAAAMSGKAAGDMFDQFGTDEKAPQAEEAAGLMLRAMIQAAKADGEIDKAEQTKIMETLGADADQDDIDFLRKQLAAPVDVDALAADTPDVQKMQVYSMSLMAIRLDSEGEARYLDKLARAMGLNQQVVNMLHLQMGVQPLYR